MAGLTKNVPAPVRIVVHQQSRVLEIEFADNQTFRLPFELMRVYSPSAEVRGHGPGQEVLQIGKRLVEIAALDPVGNYAVQPHFNDGHNTGIFSWDYLYWLGIEQADLWQQYLDLMTAAGASREPEAQAGDSSGASSSDPLEAKAVSRPR